MGYLRSLSIYHIETHLPYAYADVTNLFEVTPREGIIYVGNSKLLRHLANQSLVVDVQTCVVKPICTSVLNITITIGTSAVILDNVTEGIVLYIVLYLSISTNAPPHPT